MINYFKKTKNISIFCFFKIICILARKLLEIIIFDNKLKKWIIRADL